MKVLYIRYKKSSGVFEGGERGAEEKFRIITEIVGNDNVDTYYVHDEKKKNRIIDILRGIWYFPQKYYYGLTPSKVSQITELAKRYDVVWIGRSVFGIIAKELKKQSYCGKVFVSFHNVEATYFDAKLWRHLPFRNVVIKCADANDRYSCKYSDIVIALSERDNSEIEKRYGRKADVIAPVVMHDTYRGCSNDEMTATTPLCTILAAFFRPNNEGIEWFVRNVYPHVDIKLRIVGKGMSQLRNKDWMPENIEIHSDVPDLRPFMEETDIMILPIFSGSGMKVKTCESLMYGRNILATNEALEGYDLDSELMGGRCNTPQEFIDSIKDFSSTPRPRFNRYCRQVFLNKYSQAALTDKFRMILLQ